MSITDRSNEPSIMASTDKWSRGFGMRSEICNVDF
jgi:hypothetical protein